MTATTGAKRIMLMACWTMNKADDAGQLRELVEAIETQRKIPGVLSVESGPRTQAVDWEGPDEAFDYAMVVTFENFVAVRAYPAHPLHQMLVGTILYVGSDIRWFWMDRPVSGAQPSFTADAKHILTVYWVLRDPHSEADRRELVEALEAQRNIPGVKSIEYGPRTEEVDWEGPDKAFDYGMVLSFDHFDSARAYVHHPLHQRLVGTILRLGSDVSKIRAFWIDR